MSKTVKPEQKQCDWYAHEKKVKMLRIAKTLSVCTLSKVIRVHFTCSPRSLLKIRIIAFFFTLKK